MYYHILRNFFVIWTSFQIHGWMDGSMSKSYFKKKKVRKLCFFSLSSIIDNILILIYYPTQQPDTQHSHRE
jgi:hypothetical protein